MSLIDAGLIAHIQATAAEQDSIVQSIIQNNEGRAPGAGSFDDIKKYVHEANAQMLRNLASLLQRFGTAGPQ